MRILVGTIEVAGVLLDWADGFRQLGHKVTSVVKRRHRFNPLDEYDVDLNWSLPWPEWIANARFPLIRFPRAAVNHLVRDSRVLPLIPAHDLFLFVNGGTSLMHWNWDLPVLKRLKKRIVWTFLGTEGRHYPSFVKQYQDSSLTFEFLQELKKKGGNSPLLGPLRATRISEKCGDLILSTPDGSTVAIRPYMHYYVPMRLARHRYSIPGREVPVVVHAPSGRRFKGTEPILSTLSELKNQGVRFELKVLEEVPNEEVIAALAEADVVVDQLYSGGYGKLALEAMASGCAVATRAYDVFWPYSPEQPMWHIELGNLYPQLKRLLTDRSLRIRLAKEGRKYVERYHDHVNVARRVLDLVSQERIDKYDYYPTYFARDFRLDDGEVIPAKLKRNTAQIVQRWGLPEDVDPQDLMARGLMSADGFDWSKPIPRWKSSPRSPC